MTATTEKFAIAPSPNATEILPQNLQLQEIVRSLPKACFEKNRRKAWLSVLLSVAAVTLGYLAIATLPWFLLPFAWLFTGTALTGFFVIAHDCGHRSFAKRRWVNDWVGHTLMLPLIYPFHCWRILHNHHHLHTNKLDVDNAWEPWEPQDFREKSVAIQFFYRRLRGWFWWIGSIAHWGKLHFDLNQFTERDRPKAKFSIMLVALFAALFFPTLILTTGLVGLVKFWLMPWLAYHFWMSTFTLVHHTDSEIYFYPEAQWSAGASQLFGTVHCSYPHWVEILCHDINVHIPHHVSVAIPSYNLRKAHRALDEQWGDRLQKRKFSWSLMQKIVSQCHLYHPEHAYQPFKSLR